MTPTSCSVSSYPPPTLILQGSSPLTNLQLTEKSIGRQSKACFVIEIHKIRILPFFNKFEPGPNL